MNIFKKINITLVLIILLATFLRFWHLGKVPPSPDWDEVSLGYNAYSIMLTGRDEYGKLFPVVLKSFDDYKPALYSYLTIPFIKILGLNIISVRLPSVIFGILTVLTIYYLVRELFSGKDRFKISYLAAFLLAISPWHIQFSRIAFESNIGLAFNIFTFFFFLKGIKKAPYLLLAALFAAAAIYVYQAEKVFTPLLVLFLVIIYWRDLLKVDKKYIFSSLFFGILLILPMGYYILTDKNSLLRAKGVSVFSDQTQFLKRNTEKIIFDKRNNDLFGFILDNRRIEYLKAIISGYISHFDLNWLFITGDIERHHAPHMGLLYLFEFPFVFIGIYKLLYGDFDKKTKLIIFSYFLLVPIPASVTTGVPHAVRTLNFVPIFEVFSSIGIITAIEYVLKIKYRIIGIKLEYLILIFLSLFFVINFSYYLNQYFSQLNYFDSKEWQYGYKEVVPYVKKNYQKYNKIVVTNKAPLDQSYIFFLFYLKYPPALYQKETRNVSGGFREDHHLDKFEFRMINWEKENRSIKALFVGGPFDFPSNAKVLKTINYLDNKPAIKVVEN